ncbi:MAG TPA: YggS family pyridoxal phosphate-dependent enzyme [Candidatus Limiplasma sp.]|nr:YggS family pyridoxal phosphate-dependent enzyme [Candidatus Limiplasma sp.]HPS81744.1 YggS family pyridoxal phosphate-dependent enzyme [Candidatus Limiplasma sp.]
MQEHHAAAALIDTVSDAALSRNVNGVLQTLQRNRYGEQPPARLIAVTKTVTPGVINRLSAFGIRDIGENRAQVVLPKLPEIDPQFHLHWIGRLQTNKVKDIIEKVWLLQSLDRPELAEEVERRADQHGLVMPALVQVNIAEEPQKAGFAVGDVRPFLRRMADFHCLRIRGLMAIMPLTEDEAALTALFRGMRALFEQLREEATPGVFMEELSMGMSHDYALAAKAGATMVRVGTALYRQE